MAKKIYERKVSGKRGRGRSRLTLGNTVSKIMKEGHLKSMKTSRRVCLNYSGRGERVMQRP